MSYKNRKYEIDEKYQRTVLENLKITDFDHNYALFVHPEPPMQDVLMLLQYDPALKEEDVINYKDYGLTERLSLTKIPEEMANYVSTEENKVEIPRSPLNSTEVDITEPLTPQEWKLWFDIVVATKGHGYLQILPVGYRSSHAFSANLIHIVPKKTRDWGNFESPLDQMISIREQFYKKENKRLFDEGQSKKEREAKSSKFSVTDEDKELQEKLQKEEEERNEHIYKFSKENIFKLPEFDFPHYVCILDSKPSENSLMTDFQKICEELDLENIPSIGITVLLNEKWMFVSTLSQPYMQMENNLDLFIEPFSYAGILNIHTKEKSWPQTAGIDVMDSIKPYLPCKAYSEALPSQLPEKEPPVEEEDEYDEPEGEGENKEGEGEGEKENETKDLSKA